MLGLWHGQEWSACEVVQGAGDPAWPCRRCLTHDSRVIKIEVTRRVRNRFHWLGNGQGMFSATRQHSSINRGLPSHGRNNKRSRQKLEMTYGYDDVKCLLVAWAGDSRSIVDWWNAPVGPVRWQMCRGTRTERHGDSSAELLKRIPSCEGIKRTIEQDSPVAPW